MNGLFSIAMLNYQRVHDVFLFSFGPSEQKFGVSSGLAGALKKRGDGSVQFGMNISPRVCLEIGHNYI